MTALRTFGKLLLRRLPRDDTLNRELAKDIILQVITQSGLMFQNMFCRVRLFKTPGIYPGITHTRGGVVSFIQHHNLPNRFCAFY